MGKTKQITLYDIIKLIDDVGVNFELEKFSKEQVDIFLYRLADICSQWEKIVSKEDLQKAQKSFRNSLKWLQMLADGSLSDIVLYEDYSKTSEKVQHLRDKADLIEQELHTLTTMISTSPLLTRESGRPPADSDDLVYRIGLAFHESFGKLPTTTKEELFYKLVRIALKCVGLPNDDPSRRIKSAVEKIKSQGILMFDPPNGTDAANPT